MKKEENLKKKSKKKSKKNSPFLKTPHLSLHHRTPNNTLVVYLIAFKTF